MSHSDTDFFATDTGHSVAVYNRISRVMTGYGFSFAAFKDDNGIKQIEVLGLPICHYVDDLHNWSQIKQIATQMGDDAALGMTLRLLVRATGDDKKLLANGVKQLLKNS